MHRYKYFSQHTGPDKSFARANYYYANNLSLISGGTYPNPAVFNITSALDTLNLCGKGKTFKLFRKFLCDWFLVDWHRTSLVPE